MVDKTDIESVLQLYIDLGQADYIGEPVSQIEHMSQAAQLAMRAGSDDEVILAAFFHDIGHLCELHEPSKSMGDFGVVNHERVGADFLRRIGFPETVARLVECHVEAKRYLVWKDPAYLLSLSEASLETLNHQGGAMSDEEAKSFEVDPLFERYILLRKWDEAAKQTDVPVLDLDVIRKLAFKVCNTK